MDVACDEGYRVLLTGFTHVLPDSASQPKEPASTGRLVRQGKCSKCLQRLSSVDEHTDRARIKQRA